MKTLSSPGGQMQPTQGEKKWGVGPNVTKLQEIQLNATKCDRMQPKEATRSQRKKIDRFVSQVGGANGEAGRAKSSNRETSAVDGLLLSRQTYQGPKAPGTVLCIILLELF